jgi:hypothetical protein
MLSVIMLNFTFYHIMVSVVMLNVVVLSVMAPIDGNIEYVNNRRKNFCLIFF